MLGNRRLRTFLVSFKNVLSVSTALILFLTTIPISAVADDRTTVTQEEASQLTSQAEQFRNEQRPINPKVPPPTKIVVEKEKETAPESEGGKLFVKKINLQGNQILSTKELAPLYVQLENREVRLKELKEAAVAITGHYRAKGYILSRAFLPPQDIKDGVVTIQVVEGRIETIEVEGNRFFRKNVYTSAIHLKKNRAFQVQELERSLYFLNQKPDRAATAYLMPGKDPGTAKLVLKAKEVIPMHAWYEFNNRGTKLTHRARHLLNYQNNSLFGQGDILYASLVMAEQGAFDGQSISYIYPFEKTGTILGFDSSYAKSKLVKDLKPLRVRGTSLSLQPSVTQNIITTQKFVLAQVLAFEIKDSKISVSDSQTSFERTRVIRTGTKMSLQDRLGRTSLSADIHVGIPNFMGSMSTIDSRSSRPQSGGKFTYYTAVLDRVNRLPMNSYVYLKANTQVGRKALPSVEQFRAGGGYSVRGYPESDATGDFGYSFTSELNVSPATILKKLSAPFMDNRWLQAIRMVGFLDGGQTFLYKHSAPGSDKKEFLLGTGFGFRVNLDKYVSIQADFGFPIGDKSSEKDRMQTYLTMRVGI